MAFVRETGYIATSSNPSIYLYIYMYIDVGLCMKHQKLPCRAVPIHTPHTLPHLISFHIAQEKICLPPPRSRGRGFVNLYPKMLG